MALPYTPNEGARQTCLANLKAIYAEHGQSEEGIKLACHEVARLLSRVDLDDVCEAFEAVTRAA